MYFKVLKNDRKPSSKIKMRNNENTAVTRIQSRENKTTTVSKTVNNKILMNKSMYIGVYNGSLSTVTTRMLT